MSRAQRYQALLAAAAMADRDLAVEAARSQRDGARTAALVGLIPALARAGISIGTNVADNQKLEAQTTLANRKLDVAEAAAANRESAAAQRAADAAKRDTDKATRDQRDYEFRVQKDARDLALPEAQQLTRDLDNAPGWRRFIGEADENPERLVGPPTREQAVAGDSDALLTTTAPKLGMSRSQLEAAAREARRPTETKEANRVDDIERRERFHRDSMASAAASRAAAADERRLVRDLAKGKQDKEDAKLTNSQAEDVVALDEAESAMKRIEADARKVNPNIIKKYWDVANGKLGLATDMTEYVASLQNFSSTIGVLRSGSAIGVQEQKRLDSFLVQPGDTVAVVEGKKRAFMSWINEKRSSLNRARELQGLPPLPFDSSTSSPAGATSFQAD